MPKTTKAGKPRRQELPSTLQRSSAKAQRTFAKAHDAAAAEYGEGGRAHATAYSALKRRFERVGDRWEPKAEAGPSDEAAARGGATSHRRYPTAEGVNANAPKAHLYEVARRLGIAGRSTMSKQKLVQAIAKTSRRARASARS